MLCINKDLNEAIINFLIDLNIEAFLIEDIVAINRTSMCCADVCDKLDENDSYTMILLLIKEEFLTSDLHISWAGKNDDDYFLTVYNKTAKI
jgi:hypothetical protein